MTSCRRSPSSAVLCSEASEKLEPVWCDIGQVLELYNHFVEAGLVRLGLGILAAPRAELFMAGLPRL